MNIKERILNIIKEVEYEAARDAVGGPSNYQPPRVHTDRILELLGGELEIETKEQRIKQLGTNFKWLVDQMDIIHAVLCPEDNGSWQDRVIQAVHAVKKIASDEIALKAEKWDAFIRIQDAKKDK